jgi:hypothetical protein
VSKPPAQATPVAGHGWDAQRPVGIVVAGVGAVAVGVGGAFGLRTIVLKNDRGAYCDGNNVCDPQGMQLDHDARTASTISTIATLGGVVLLAGGIALVLTSPDHSAHVSVGLGSAQVSGSW